MDKDLEEAKTTGEDSIAADAVTPAGGTPKKRKADLMKAPGPVQAGTSVVTPQGTNNAGLHEMIAALFGDTDLSEDFKAKTVTIFESAVHEKVEAVRAELEEEFDAELVEQTEAIVEELTEKVDSYLDYVVENWMKENEVALETGYKVQVAESLFANIKSIVLEHNLDIGEESVDAIAEMEEEVAQANARYNEVFEEMVALRQDKEQLEKNAAFVHFAEGMIATDVERFKVLSEGVSYESVVDYAKKLETLKDSYFSEQVTRIEDQAALLEEEVEDEVKAPAVNPAVAAYVASLNKFKI